MQQFVNAVLIATTLLLSPRPCTSERRQAAVDRFRIDVRNAVFRAEALSATQPQKALEIIEDARARVVNSGLNERIAGQLLQQLARSCDAVDQQLKVVETQNETTNPPSEVAATTGREERMRSAVEQEIAEAIEKYNGLLKEERFDEALLLGKQARSLQPENPVSELMVLKAKYAKRDALLRLSARFKATFIAHIDDPDTIKEQLRAADRTFGRLAYGDEEETTDDWRLLEAALERKIEAVDQTCRLTDAQKSKLRLAGRGDIKRSFDHLEALRPKGEEVTDNQLCGNASCFWAEAIPSRQSGLFDQGSVFSNTLQVLLTPSQAAAVEGSTLRQIDAGR